ncbi:hypothetical protein V2J09_008163 [Rumex salicifolius]
MSADESPAEAGAVARSSPRPDPPLVRCVGVSLEQASPEDGTLVSKSERVELTVRDEPDNFFRAVKKRKKGDVSVKSQDGFPQSVPDGEVDEPSNSTPLTFELVSSAEATDNEDGTEEEDEDSDSPSTRNRRYAESFIRYKEDCRKAAELKKEALEAWRRDDVF